MKIYVIPSSSCLPRQPALDASKYIRTIPLWCLPNNWWEPLKILSTMTYLLDVRQEAFEFCLSESDSSVWWGFSGCKLSLFVELVTSSSCQVWLYCAVMFLRYTEELFSDRVMLSAEMILPWITGEGIREKFVNVVQIDLQKLKGIFERFGGYACEQNVWSRDLRNPCSHANYRLKPFSLIFSVLLPFFQKYWHHTVPCGFFYQIKFFFIILNFLVIKILSNPLIIITKLLQIWRGKKIRSMILFCCLREDRILTEIWMTKSELQMLWRTCLAFLRMRVPVSRFVNTWIHSRE